MTHCILQLISYTIHCQVIIFILVIWISVATDDDRMRDVDECVEMFSSCLGIT